jgi:hypothetical protein
MITIQEVSPELDLLNQLADSVTKVNVLIEQIQKQAEQKGYNDLEITMLMR